MTNIKKSKENNGNGSHRILLNSCLVIIPCLLSWSLCSSSSSSTHHNINKKDFLHAISGAIGSALSITLLYPLETSRTRLQVDTSLTVHSPFLLIYNIGKKEGLKGLYKGWASLVVALFCLNLVYFYCFHALRRWVTGRSDGAINKVVVDLIAGYLAGVVGVLVTGPLWLVNTRLKLEGVNIVERAGNVDSKQYTGIFHCIYKIFNEEGILTLWHGTFTSIILALNPAIQLGVYEMLKRHHLIIGGSDIDGSGSSSGSLEPFVNALLAKFIATVITYPIQVLQTRHRANMQPSQSESWHILRLYRGLESKLLQTCLSSALMFVLYERLLGILTLLLLMDEMNEK